MVPKQLIDGLPTHPLLASNFNRIPSWLLGGSLGALAGLHYDDEDRLRGALAGTALGATGGHLWDKIPFAAQKIAFVGPPLSPSISSNGSLSLSYSPKRERLPGTSNYVSQDVIERIGKSLDQGGSYNDTVAAGANSYKSRYLPIATTILGSLIGRSISNTPGGYFGGAALGVGAGYLGKEHLQNSLNEESKDATKGVLLERARIGDPSAQQMVLENQHMFFPQRM